MDRKHKAYLKLNIMSLFFIAISSISVTLAWFAYSGIAKVSTEINVKSWLIEFTKNDTTVSNDIVISLSEIYPGMDTIHETVKIENKGDSDAQLSYSIASARILDQELPILEGENDNLKDKLSHDYPFSININLSKNFIVSNGEASVFDMSISWPLDSNNDELDSQWGNQAYQFGVNEQEKYNNDSTYKIKPSIKIVINVKAEQIVDSTPTNVINNLSVEETQAVVSNSPTDINYSMGDLILYDVSNNIRCNQLSENCIRTHVIDINNKVGDSTVTLLPNLLDTYSSGAYDKYDELLASTITNWKVSTRPLQIDDLLKVISKDVINSLIIKENLSDSIIGYVNYGDRINRIINETVLHNGYYSFLNENYEYLATNKCYWLNKEYKDTKAFALTKFSEDRSIIYGEEKSTSCEVIPVILAPKQKLNIQ